jgi:hypothetical protein
VWVVLNQWAIWELIERERRKPIRKRRHKAQDSGEPKPFPGLAQKPVCDECEKEGQGEVCEVAAPPKMMSGRGRPAEVDTSVVSEGTAGKLSWGWSDPQGVFIYIT